MAYFWQLSGPESHFERKWDRGNPNEGIANVVLGNFKRMVKTEGGLTLLVGAFNFKLSRSDNAIA